MTSSLPPDIVPVITFAEQAAVIALRFLAGRQRKTAVAHHHRGYAMRVRMLKTLSGKKNHGTLLEVTKKLKGFNVTQIP